MDGWIDNLRDRVTRRAGRLALHLGTACTQISLKSWSEAVAAHHTAKARHGAPAASAKSPHLIDPLPSSKGGQTCKYLAFSASTVGDGLCLI